MGAAASIGAQRNGGDLYKPLYFFLPEGQRHDIPFLIAELQVIEPGVGAVRAQELGVRPGLDHAPALNDMDEVGAQDGGEAVRDDERGAPIGELAQRALDDAFGLTVERR